MQPFLAQIRSVANLIDSNGVDLTEYPVFESEGHDVFHRVENLFPGGAECLGGLLPGKPARPAGQEQHIGPSQSALSIAPGNFLDDDGLAAGGEATYVASVLTIYADLPDTPWRPSPMDQSLARRLHWETVPLSLVESALLLRTWRRPARPDHFPPLPRIRSLVYFLPVIAELQQQPLPAGYLDYLRLKLPKLVEASRPDRRVEEGRGC